MKVELQIPKEMAEKFNRIADSMLTMLQGQISAMNTTTNFAVPQSVMYDPEPPTEEQKTCVEAWLKQIDPIIEKEAVSMLKKEIRGMMLMGGNVKALAKALKEGKKPKLVRKKQGKKDPLFIQIGDGVDEPIEEIHIFG